MDSPPGVMDILQPKPHKLAERDLAEADKIRLAVQSRIWKAEIELMVSCCAKER